MLCHARGVKRLNRLAALQSVHLELCPHVTDFGLQKLMGHVPSITVTGCDQLDERWDHMICMLQCCCKAACLSEAVGSCAKALCGLRELLPLTNAAEPSCSCRLL